MDKITRQDVLDLFAENGWTIFGKFVDDVADAIADGLDLFITGEIYHQNFHEALENKINVIAGGHYQSETFGVKAVMRMVLGELGIEGEFISWPTAL